MQQTEQEKKVTSSERSKVVSIDRLQAILNYDPVSGTVTVRKSSRVLFPDTSDMATVYDPILKVKRKIKFIKLCWMLANNAEVPVGYKVFAKDFCEGNTKANNLGLIPDSEYLLLVKTFTYLNEAKIVPHPEDAYKSVLEYRMNKSSRRETFDDLDEARTRLEQLKRQLVKKISKFILTK